MIGAQTGSSIDGYILIAIFVVFWGGAILWGRKSRTVSEVKLDNEVVVISLLGPSRLLSLRKEVRFPIQSVVEVISTPNVFGKGGTFSRKIGSVTIPTFFRVGSFRGARGQGASFWACFTGQTAITFHLSGQKYQYVIIDVQDPAETVSLIEKYSN